MEDTLESLEEDSQNNGAGSEGGVADLSRSVSFHNMAGVADGVVEVAMASDFMSATATFFPPRGDGLPVDPSFVYVLLNRIGVTSGT